MPRFAQSSPLEQDPERAQLIQAYMVLTAKQTSVRRRLSAASASPPISPVSTPAPSSPVLEGAPATPPRRQSPTSSTRSPGRPQRSPFLRRPSVPSIPELPEQEADIDSDEEKLATIATSILTTLTDLLSCPSVQDDPRMRSWVQTRLFDAQRSLPRSTLTRPRSVGAADVFTMTPASDAAAQRYRARRSGSVAMAIIADSVVPATYRYGTADTSCDGVRKMSL